MEFKLDQFSIRKPDQTKQLCQPDHPESPPRVQQLETRDSVFLNNQLDGDHLDETTSFNFQLFLNDNIDGKHFVIP